MKKILFSLYLVGCSVESNLVPKSAETNTTTAVATSTSSTSSGSRHVANPNKDICSYDNDPDKGCLKAVIASTQLRIGNFSYPIGPKEFARQFPSDLVSEGEVSLDNGEILEFVQTVTQQNFFGSFYAGISGAHTTYYAVHTGLGNIQINNMAPGFYEIQISKEFELRVLDHNDSIVGYKCAVIWANRPVDISLGKETAASEAISEFELKIFDTSCNGSKNIRKTKTSSSTNTSTNTNTNTNTSTSTNTNTNTNTNTSTNTHSNTHTNN